MLFHSGKDRSDSVISQQSVTISTFTSDLQQYSTTQHVSNTQHVYDYQQEQQQNYMSYLYQYMLSQHTYDDNNYNYTQYNDIEYNNNNR